MMRLVDTDKIIDMEEPPAAAAAAATPQVAPSPSKDRNRTLERESQGFSSVLTYSTIFLAFDVWKQVTSYGMKYYNDDRYPMPQTKVVAITETLKFVIFFAYVVVCGHVQHIGLSPWYVVPSLIYAINNNIYYYALHFTTPPVWNILIQLRIITTALAYRVIFKRVISQTQWLGIGLLIIAIILTNFTMGQPVGEVKVTSNLYSHLFVTLLLAIVGSMTSAAAALSMEYLFKNDTMNFSEMQLQLYLFGSMSSWTFFGVESLRPETASVKINAANKDTILAMVVGCILLSCASGIAVAAIVKKLDNIVKLYTQAVSNLLTSLACGVFFPEAFDMDVKFVFCLSLMLAAVFMYESKSLVGNGPSVWGNLTTAGRDWWNAVTPAKNKKYFAKESL